MKRLAVCLAVAMLATFAAASPAAAQYAVYYDRDGGGGTAIQRIEVQNGTDNVWVWIGHKWNLAGDEVYLDTVPSDLVLSTDSGCGPTATAARSARSRGSLPA